MSLKAATELIKAASSGLDQLFTSGEEKQDAIIKAAEIRRDLALAQIRQNTAETQHRSLFVAGWRPAVGWICATALAYHYIVRDMLSWIMAGLAPEAPPPPGLEMAELMTLLLTMLGSASLRTYEKNGGLTR